MPMGGTEAIDGLARGGIATWGGQGHESPPTRPVLGNTTNTDSFWQSHL